MQDRPICFKCKEPVEHSPLFEAPCGPDHHECPSAVFHGLCLMEWREHFAEWIQHIREYHMKEAEDDLQGDG